MRRQRRKRLMALLLVVLLGITTILPQDGLQLSVKAAEKEEIVCTINGKDVTKANQVTIPYGDTMTLGVKGYSGTEKARYFYLTGNTILTEDTEWINEWTEDKHPTAIGEYYVAMSLEDTSENVNVQDFDGRYKFAIVKSELGSPETIGWENGSKAVWSQVTKTETGTSIANSVIKGYEIQLYKDGVAVGEKITTTLTEEDFTDVILENGKGKYTYTIKTLAKDAVHYADSASKKSEQGAYGVSVTVAKGDGIRSVTPTESTFLIAGNTEHNKIRVEAEVEAGHAFESWTVGEITGFTPENASSKMTSYSLAAGDPGCDTIQITANAKDTENPVIEQYKVITDGKLQGVFGDTGTGVVAYGFSTASKSEDVEWIAMEAASHISKEYKVEAPGTYYLWIKDGAGNVVKSESGYVATKVVYHNYYQEEQPKDFVQYYVGDGTFTLTETLRSGYSFKGWYGSADFHGEAIDVLNSHDMSVVDVYARWEMKPISFKQRLQGVEKEYDGKSYRLDGTVQNATGTIKYQWYKNDVIINGATDAIYEVKNVVDSGQYKVKVTMQIGDDGVTAFSDEASVVIRKKALVIKGNDVTLTYGDEKPTLSAQYDAFVEGEDVGNLIGEVKFSCEYQKGDGVGNYSIIVSGVSSDNYEITWEEGILKVLPKDVTKANSGITVTEPSGSTYDGTEKTPQVAVKRDGNALSNENYDIVYKNNVDAGTADVCVEFKGNYTGTITKHFTIAKATFSTEMTLEGWTYGDTKPIPQVVSNNSGGVVTYVYKQENGDETTEQPTDAGIYEAHAVIAATKNYEASETDAITFSIAKRIITLTASNGTWIYDGTRHSDSHYEMEGTFAGTDDFQNVTVSGVIRDKGTVDNVLTYRLTSATNPQNYEIRCINGVLKVDSKQLNGSTNLKWDTTTPGKGNWLAVAKDGVNVRYKVRLYNQENQCIFTDTTQNAYYDFSREIKAYSDEAASYSYSVEVLPYDGENAENYDASDESEKSEVIYTAVVEVERTKGVQSVTIDGTSKQLMIQGESATVVAQPENGYTLNSTVWSATGTEFASVAFGSLGSATSTFKINNLSKASNISVVAFSNDIEPSIAGYKAVRNAKGDRVTLSAQISDIRGVKKYAFTQSNQAPEAESELWTMAAGETSKEVEQEVTNKGTYYLWVCDESDNMVCSSGLQVYRIDFLPGEGVGTMDSVLKIQNAEIVLPENKYTKQDYGFQQWKGSLGYYANGGVYSANTDDLLTAQWTNEVVEYKVHYYLMDTTGTYGETPSRIQTFTGAAGSTVHTKDEQVALTDVGFSLDDERCEDVTLTTGNQVLNVYYKRNQHTITYRYLFAGNVITDQVATYYYAQEFPEAIKPEQPGYDFVGWVYENVGTKPDKMGDQNMIASGYFTKQSATYEVNCYTKNLQGDEYTLVSSTEYQIEHDTTLTVGKATAPMVDGFTASGVVLSQGVPSGSKAEGMLESTEATVLASGDKLHINYYYSRNSYDLTLNVWKGSRENGDNRIYQKTWSIPYGQTLNPEDYSEAEKEQWPVGHEEDLAGYHVADYADWSTGEVPNVMPAGSVVVARDYVSSTVSEYKIQVYYEKATEGQYAKQTELTYYGQQGAVVSVGNSNEYTINVNNFNDSLPYLLDRYEYAQTEESVEQGVVQDSETPSGPLILKVYFNRKKVNTAIKYYYIDEDGGTTQFASKTINDKWGHSYEVKPAAFFDADSEAQGFDIQKDAALAKNYREDGYVATYVSYSQAGWKTKQILSADELAQPVSFALAQPKSSASNYVSVYYSKPNPEKQVTLKAVYRTNNLTHSADHIYNSNNAPRYALSIAAADVTTTATKTVEEMEVRIINASALYQSTYEAGAEETRYPGAAKVTGSYQVSDQLREGYYEATVEGYSGTYYTDGTYLYAVNTANNMYIGNCISYSYGSNRPGCAEVDKFLADYKADHKDSSQVDTYDSNWVGAFTVYNNFGGQILSNQLTAYTMYYDYHSVYTLTYNLGGTTCNNHKFAEGSTATVGCEDGVFERRPGYHITWYRDSDFATPATPFTITGDTTVYGHYVKDTMRYQAYVSYELPTELAYGEGHTTRYLTKNVLAQLAPDTVTKEETTTPQTFLDGEGNNVQEHVTTTKYYYGGELALICVSKPTLSYSNVSFDYTSYAKDGFYYDVINVNNQSMGYCQTESTDLAAYYNRNEHKATVIRGNSRYENVETITYKYGANVVIEAPQKDGYAFEQWEARRRNDQSEEWQAWTTAPEANPEGALSFSMPDYDIQLEAVWKPSNLNSTITHYFENSTRSYDKDLLARCIESDTTEVCGVWTIYYEDESKTNCLGVSSEKDGVTYYYRTGEKKDGTVNVKDYDLFAAVSHFTARTEANIETADYILADIGDMFSYSYTTYQNDSEVSRYGKTDHFINMPNIQVEYYYSLASGYVVNVDARATDGGVSGATVRGSGSYYYHSDVSLKAIVKEGYTLLGWYKASDVLEGYDQASGKSLSEYTMKDVTGFTPVSTSDTLSYVMEESEDYVVVTKASEAAMATVSVGGKSSYDYGYSSNMTDRVLIASARLPEDADAANFIYGYQWYEVVNGRAQAILGATAATYNFPSGKEVGTYPYYCQVTVKRQDNGRSSVVKSDEFEVNVAAAAVTIETKNYMGTYDGAVHKATVTVKNLSEGYTIYYGTTELTEANYFAEGSTVNPTYRDVVLEDGQAVARKIYYYIACDNHNYRDSMGNVSVKILPKKLTLTSTGIFSKTFDGRKEILGDVREEGSQAYQLAHSDAYRINGMIASDIHELLDFKAAFNDEHVVDANTVTISECKIIHEDGSNNNNYYFEASDKLTLPGYINPYSVLVAWTNTSFTYDDTRHEPIASIEDKNVPIHLDVAGGQVNAGQYTAIASVQSNETYRSSDYSLLNDTVDYSINKRELMITPKDTDVVYDGTEKTITQFTTENLVAGQHCSAKASASQKEAGTVNKIKATDVTITSGADKDVTDNYLIQSKEGTLRIAKRVVSVLGLGAEDKTYDGDTVADVTTDSVTFNNIVVGDSLQLTGVTANFDRITAGDSKAVTFSYATASLTGESAANYELDVETSQKTTTAGIAKKEVSVKPVSKVITYGEVPTYEAVYDGFIEGEDSSVITGAPVFHAQKGETPFSQYSSVGEYDLTLDVENLAAENYRFVEDQTVAKTLTVKPKTLTVRAATGKKVCKTYDGTVAADTYVSAEDYEVIGIVNSDVVHVTFQASFNSKNVATADKVQLTELNIDNINYQLANETCQLPAEIQQKDLTVQAENKEITYGQATPQYSVTYAGFITGEGVDNLLGVIDYDCSYDVSQVTKRGVDKYTITPKGYLDDNYHITYAVGELNVKKAKVTVTASDKQVTYGDDTPAYTCSLTGFQYEDDKAVVTGAPVYTCAREKQSEAGQYAITPDVATLSADNYVFEGKAGILTVTKREMTISGLTADDKKYDAKKTAPMVTTSMVAANMLPEDTSAHSIAVKGTFQDGNVGEDIPITIAYTLDTYLGKRYIISTTSQQTTQASILQKELVVTADNQNIPYGSLVPEYSVSYDGFAEGESKEELGSEFFKITCSYATYSPVGNYDISATGYESTNYAISYERGNLNVVQTKMTQTTPVWSDTTPGEITWEAVSKVGDVSVDHYEVRLYDSTDNVTPIASENVGATDKLAVNFCEVMRSHGAGSYQVSIVSVPKTENNIEYVNVIASEAAISEAIWVTNVRAVIASDEISKHGATNAKIQGNDSYLMVAGEKDKAVSATLQNSTGYGVASWKDTQGILTTAGLQKEEGSKEVTAKVSLAANCSVAELDLILTLNATPVTLKTEAAQTSDSVAYGYTETTTPTLSIEASVERDNITEEGYTYEYQWQLYQLGRWVDLTGEQSEQYIFPVGKKVGNYRYRCKVTATRGDNDLKTTKTSNVLVVAVEKTSFSASVTMENWKYGETRKEPVLTSSESEAQGTTYYYSDATDGTFTTDIPTDAGHYWVYADIPESANFNAVQTEKAEFYITANKLNVPTQLQWAQSQTVELGKATWTTVDGVKENQGVGSTSEIHPSYEVKLYRDGILIQTIQNVEENACDLSAYMTEKGVYTYSVRAMSDNENNCTNSLESSKSAQLYLDRDVEIIEGDVDKIYDGEQVTLKVEQKVGDTYQWLRNGELIESATDAEISMTDVNESGCYQCRVVNGGNVYSTMVRVTIRKANQTIESQPIEVTYDGLVHEVQGQITWGDGVLQITGNSKRNVGEYEVEMRASATDNFKETTKIETLHILKKSLSIAADDAEKKYDGTALTKETYTNTALAEGQHIESVEINGSQTRVGKSANVASGAVIQTTGGTDVTGNYEITYHDGTLEVLQKELTITAGSASKNYDGMPLKNNTYEKTELVIGDQLKEVKLTGSQTTVGSSANVPSDAVIKNMANEDVTSCYAIHYVEGILRVQQTPTELTITNDISKTYDGEAVEKPEVTKSRDGEVIVTYYDKDKNPLPQAPMHGGEYYVRASMEQSQDGGYGAIQTDYVAFEIERASVEILAANVDVTYDGTVHRVEATRTEGAGALTYQNNGKSRVGTYTVTVNVEETVDYEAASKDVTLKIHAKALTIKPKSETKQYDDTPLIATECVPEGLAEGDQIHSVKFTGSQIQIGTSKSQVSNAVVYNAAEEDVTDCYTITYEEGNLSVEQRSTGLAITNDISKTYDGTKVNAPQTSASREGAVTITYYDSEKGQLDAAPINAGRYYVKASMEESADHSFAAATTEFVPFTIRKASQVIVGTDVSETYDGTTHQATASITTGDGLLTYEGDAREQIYAGRYVIVAEASETDNYEKTRKEIILLIAKRPLTITGRDAEKVYDGSALTNTEYDFTELVTGDVLEQVMITGSQTNGGVSSNTLSQVIIKNGSGADVTNSYDVTYVPGKLTVKRASDVVTITNSLTKEYNAKAAGIPTYTRSGNGAVQILYYNIYGQRLAYAPKDVGNYYVQVVSGESQNYERAQSEKVPFSIVIPRVPLPQAAPKPNNIKITNTTYADNGTGEIAGVNKNMEYSGNNGKAWKPCTGNKITGLLPGTYLIRYKGTTLYAASVAIKVTVKSKSVELYVPTIVMSKTMGYKQKFQIKLLNMKGAKVTCKSSNTKVATVNKKGIVTSKKKKGKATITINMTKGKYKTQYILKVNTDKKVKKNYSLVKYKTKYKYTSIALYKLMEPKQKYKIKFKNLTKKAKIKCSTNNKKVATVTKSGTVKGKGLGKATVTIQVTDKGRVYKWYMVVRVAKAGVISDTSYLKVVK